VERGGSGKAFWHVASCPLQKNGKDPRYKAEFEDCEEIIRDTIREEIRRRAIDGIKRPIMYRGKQCAD